MSKDTVFTSSDIEKCFKAPTPDRLDSELQAGIDDLRKGSKTSDIEAGSFFHKFIQQFPDTVSDCPIESLDDDLDSIDFWSLIFEDPEKLSKTVTENYIQYKDMVTDSTTQLL